MRSPCEIRYGNGEGRRQHGSRWPAAVYGDMPRRFIRIIDVERAVVMMLMAFVLPVQDGVRHAIGVV